MDILVNAGAIGCNLVGLTWDEQHDVQTIASCTERDPKLAFDVNADIAEADAARTGISDAGSKMVVTYRSWVRSVHERHVDGMDTLPR